MSKKIGADQLLGSIKPASAVIRLAVPATLALLAKAVYNIVDTAYIGMLGSDTALAAVGVTLPILLIMVSVENIFSAGAAVIAGRHLGAGRKEEANSVITGILALSLLIGLALCLLGIRFMSPLLVAFGASEAVLPEACDYALWMFVAALFNLPAQLMNSAARAESSARISSVAVITGALLNVILDPVFMFDWGFGMGVEGASLATTLSQLVTFAILAGFYLSGRSVIQIRPTFLRLKLHTLKAVTLIGVPTAVIQICLSLAASLTNIAAKSMPDADLIIAAFGVVQRLMLIGCYLIMGFMQGYQPVAAYSFGAGDDLRFHQTARFALRGSIALAAGVTALFALLSRPLIAMFNQNPLIISYGSRLLLSQSALFVAFGLCYMMTITFQTIGDTGYGLFLSSIRQGLYYAPLILVLPRLMGLKGFYLAQPVADALTLLTCALSIGRMKETASRRLLRQASEGTGQSAART